MSMNEDRKHIKVGEYTDTECDTDMFSKIWSLRPEKPQYCKFMGKEIKLPRRTINYSTNNVSYSGYMGATDDIEEPPTFLSNYLDTLGYCVLGAHNNVLINFYDGGGDYIGFHKDSIKNFKNKDEYRIHTVSLYEDIHDYRTLRFKHNITRQNMDFKITDRMTVSFDKYINDNYKHTITKRKQGGKRISITLRCLN